jgi:hypothetical protein
MVTRALMELAVVHSRRPKGAWLPLAKGIGSAMNAMPVLP